MKRSDLEDELTDEQFKNLEEIVERARMEGYNDGYEDRKREEPKSAKALLDDRLAYLELGGSWQLVEGPNAYVNGFKDAMKEAGVL